MKSVVWYVLFIAVVIVSWGLYAQQRITRTTGAPAQTMASIESRPGTSAGR